MIARRLLVCSLLLASLALAAAVRHSASQSFLEADSSAFDSSSSSDLDGYDEDDGMSQFPGNTGFHNSSVSFLESESELEVGRFEFPSASLCAAHGHDSQYNLHDAFKAYFEQRPAGPGGQALPEYVSPYVFTPADVSGTYPAAAEAGRNGVEECPTVGYDPANPDRPLFFAACCGSHNGMRRNYHCEKIMQTADTDPPNPYQKLKDKWVEARRALAQTKDKSHHVAAILKAIQVPCSGERSKFKVCDRNEQCGTGSVCCWSRRNGAPGLCRKGDSCGKLKEHVFGRCDTTADCLSTSAAKKCCYIHGRRLAGGRRLRRGFCSTSDKCGDKKTSFECGVGNSCALAGPNLKCCQTLGVTVDFDPKRHCEASCQPVVGAGEGAKADITNKHKDHTPLIPTLPLSKKKTKDTVFARSYNMMRFAQMASSMLDHTKDFEAFESIQKKMELEEYCESDWLKMGKTAKTAALHIANSMLSVLSPYLLVEMTYHSSAEKELTFKDTFVTLGDINGDSVNTLNAHFGNVHHADLAKKALYYLMDFKDKAPASPNDPVILAVYKFLTEFTLDPDAQKPDWFKKMTANFKDVTSKVKESCDRYVRLEYFEPNQQLQAGQTPAPSYLLKKVDYARFAHWMADTAKFDEYLNHHIKSLAKKAGKDDAGQNADVARIKPLLVTSFAKGKVCYSIWNKIIFGLHLLDEMLETKNEKWNKKLGILSEVTSITGTLASSVSFGGSAVAAKAINFAIKQVQKNIAKQTEANEAMIEALLVDFLADPAKEYNQVCNKFVTKANAASTPRRYESLCPEPVDLNSFFDETHMPQFLRPLVTSYCTKAHAAYDAYKKERKKEDTAVAAANANFPAPAAAAALTPPQILALRKRHVNNDAEVKAARAAAAVPALEMQRHLDKVVGVYRLCNFNNDLEAQFNRIDEIFKASLSMMSCGSESSYYNDAREHFTEHVVAVSNEQRDLHSLYHNMLKEGGALKLLEALVKVVGAVAEPLGARFMEMTFGHLAAFENIEQSIMQGMANSGIAMGIPVTQEQVAQLNERIDELEGHGEPPAGGDVPEGEFF